MWRGTRQAIIQRHDFYVEQVKKRVISHFSDVEVEAERFADTEYDRLCSLPGDEDSDLSIAAEIAEEHGQQLYLLLYDLRRQMLLGALAGCFHQRDVELRDFLEAEFLQYSNEAREIVWGPANF
jgi:hypothetical protein